MITHRNGGVLHAVALGSHFTVRSRQISALLTTGVVSSFNTSDVMLSVPNFVEERLVNACGPAALHTTETELAARTRILAKLRKIENEIELALRHVGNRAATFYDHLKSGDPHEWKKVTVQTAAEFFQRPGGSGTPLAVKIATHKHLMDHPRNFIAHPTAYRETQVFLVRPSAQVQNIIDVTNWMRVDGGRILNEFCDKIKVILEQAETLRQQSTLTMPHEIPANFNCTLNDTDREILRFLADAIHIQRLTQFIPHSLPTTYILKRLDLLDNTEWPVNQMASLQRLLTGLGILTPWSDCASIASRVESQAHQPTMRALRAPAFPRKPLGPEDFYSSDPLEALRHDFGDMPVYVIDDASASELDDGVSIETIPSEPDNHWVHVHVADPTTLLPPTHMLAYKARLMSESSYSAFGTDYMLPPPTFEKFSLGNTAATGEPQQAITFSFKVDSAGDLIDYKVRAALVKNIQILTYDAVDATLGLPSFTPTSPFNPSDLSLPSYPPIEPSHVERLKLLHKVSSRLIANRVRLPAFSYAFPSSSVRFTSPIPPSLPSPLDIPDLAATKQLKVYGGFPDMLHSVDHPQAVFKGSRAMVSEFMKGACRVASRFGVETGTPLVRRHGSGPIGPDPADIERLIASRDELGLVDPFEAAKCSISLPKSVNILAPKSHWALGIPDGEGYVRVTSPLRRYGDLVAHWQIKHALLANSNPARYGEGKRVIFSENWLTRYARELTFRDREKKRAGMASNDYWTGVFIKRWLEGDIKSEALGPKTAVFEARPGVMTVKEDYSGKHRIRSNIAQLGLWGDLTLDDPLELGSRVNVRIAGVRLGARPRISLALA